MLYESITHALYNYQTRFFIIENLVYFPKSQARMFIIAGS